MPLSRSGALTRFAGALLLAQGIYGLVGCWLEDYWGPGLFCVGALIAGLGLAYRRWWSRPVTVGLALLAIVPVIWTGWHTLKAGRYTDRNPYEIFAMVTPGVLYLMTALFCVYVAIRYVPSRPSRTKT
jgi:hypothetical protein